MIAPSSFYRRIHEIDRRMWALPHQLIIASGALDEALDRLPDDEGREVRRLLDTALDARGRLDPDRLTHEQRVYVSERLTESISDLR